MTDSVDHWGTILSYFRQIKDSDEDSRRLIAVAVLDYMMANFPPPEITPDTIGATKAILETDWEEWTIERLVDDPPQISPQLWTVFVSKYLCGVLKARPLIESASLSWFACNHGSLIKIAYGLEKYKS